MSPMNELNVSLQHSILTLAANGWWQRRIARELAIHRETVSRHGESSLRRDVRRVCQPNGFIRIWWPNINLLAVMMYPTEGARPAASAKREIWLKIFLFQ
jgi:hypothetical protein